MEWGDARPRHGIRRVANPGDTARDDRPRQALRRALLPLASREKHDRSRILGALPRHYCFLGKFFDRYAMIWLNSASLAVAPALDISATMSSHSFFVWAWAAKTSAP